MRQGTILAVVAMAAMLTPRGLSAQTPTANMGRVYTGAQSVRFANEAGTGTTVNKLAKLTGAPSTAIITATTDTAGIIGIVVAGAGTTGSADIAFAGKASCAFDSATTAGHYVVNDTSTAGDCMDGGATYPTSGQVIGVVTSTNGGAGTYVVDLTLRQPAAGGAAGGYTIIENATTPLTQRTTVNFTGAGVTCVDNGGATRTDCTIPGGGGASAYGKVTDASPIAWDLVSGAATNGVVTLDHTTATRALNISNPANGGFYTLVIKQDGTGGALMTLGTGCTWKVINGGAGAIVLSAAANAIDILTFSYDATNCYASLQSNFN
jgi:hypothetical protein